MRNLLGAPAERKVAEVSVRRYVRERKHELGWSTRTVCVPQSYQPGQEGQVDWYEAWAELAGEPTLLQVSTLRSMASGAAFHRAYHRAPNRHSWKATNTPSNIFRASLPSCATTT